MKTIKEVVIFNSKRKLFVFVFGVIYCLVCYYCARNLMRGLGDESKFLDVLPLALFFIYIFPLKKIFFYIILPILIILAIYSPFQFIYGRPNYQAIISVFSTNKFEALEYLQNIELKLYFQALLIPLLAVCSYFIAKYLSLKPWRNKTITIITISFLVILLKPTTFVHDLFFTTKYTAEQLEELHKYVNKSEWPQSTHQAKPQDYVLIIGESARRDYFHAFGYPVPNTPFLDKVKGTLVTGFTSGGNYTIKSLSNMLTLSNKKDWTPRYQYNLIDLAKSAGIKTYWLSNQGYIGRWDTPITSIANRSDEKVFLSEKYKGLVASDNKLLEELADVMTKPAKESRLIILHMIGSHPQICKRTLDMVKDAYRAKDDYYSVMACYLSSIKKTDAFIESVYNIMKQADDKAERSFSVIYFSDHGMAHGESGGKLELTNNRLSMYHHDVPLVRIDSDAKERHILDSVKSGLHFTEGLANWMHIDNPKLSKYDLFDGISDATDYGLKHILKSMGGGDDPAIDMTPYLVSK